MVRPAKPDELGRILEIYAAARRYMAENGNPAQWGSSYPRRELLEEDLRRGQLYVRAGAGGGDDLCGDGKRGVGA